MRKSIISHYHFQVYILKGYSFGQRFVGKRDCGQLFSIVICFLLLNLAEVMVFAEFL